MKITKAMGQACVDAMNAGVAHSSQLSGKEIHALRMLGWGATFEDLFSQAGGPSKVSWKEELFDYQKQLGPYNDHAAHLQLALCMAATISGVI